MKEIFASLAMLFLVSMFGCAGSTPPTPNGEIFTEDTGEEAENVIIRSYRGSAME